MDIKMIKIGDTVKSKTDWFGLEKGDHWEVIGIYSENMIMIELGEGAIGIYNICYFELDNEWKKEEYKK